MMPLFEGVKYFLPSSFSPQRIDEISHALDTNGAVHANSITEATHIVTNSHRFEGWQLIEGKETIAVVTEKWVERSLVIGKVQSPSNYSADPSMIFSGVVACAADLQPQDLEVLSAGISSLGGQWRTVLTKDVTHLFALSTESDKYVYAFAHKAQFDLKIVLPHWFDDVVRLGMGNLDVSPYEWPDPLVLKAPTDAEKGKLDSNRKGRKLDPDKRTLFTTSVLGVNAEVPAASKKDIFGRRRVLLSTTLELNTRREALESSIERANGIIVFLDHEEDIEEEARRVDECDVFVTKYRSGKAFFKAAKANKTIGTLAWLFHVLSTGVLSRPLDRLLHYPIPKRPIANFSSHEITITNYTGEAREYLKKLIATMGATFTPSMSSRNTVLIAAYMEGTKTAKAATWSIPIVSHIWLEDCFVKWQNLTVGLERYLAFPSGTDFAAYLGDRKVGSDVVDLAEVIKAEQAEEEEEGEGDPRAATAPLTTQNSARDAREVADLVESGMMEIDEAGPLDAGEDAMDIEHEQTDLRKPLQQTGQTSIPFENNTTDDPGSPSPLDVAGDEGMESDDMHDDDDDQSNEPVKVQKIVRSLKVQGKKENIGVKRTGKKRPKVQDGNGSDEEAAPAASRVNSRNTKGKMTGLSATTDEENEQEDFTVTRTSNSAVITKKRDSKNSSNAPNDPNHSSPVRPSPSPKRILSVVMPPLTLGAGSSPAANAGSSSPKQGLKKTVSIHAAASERRRDNTQSKVPTPKHRSSSSTVIGGSSPISLSHSTKRIAAARASQRLHDEVMPDVLNYQQELRNQKSRKHRPSAGSDLDHTVTRKRRSSSTQQLDDDTDEIVESWKGKTANGVKARASKEAKADGSKEGNVERKRRKSATRESTNEDSEMGDEDSVPPNQKKRKTAGNKVIKLMTTQVTLSDEVVKVLIELGVKMTTKASECTHLVVPSLVRTEKFLCALAVAPYILSESWATQSAAARELLSEEQYLLNDKVGEKKYDFSLAEALSRAKQFKGRLLAKKTFYVTSGVSMSRALLKNVVSACGGQVVTQNPSPRILRANPDRHVISCPEDEDVWRPLAKEYPIYNAELLLTGILKQMIEWDNEKFKVPGSY